ncbi:ParB/RepB/Spo0J family partition protein [Kribbella sp. NPDC050820]|uniref:ParB/RepB/Spo0J family partition protein n=1 Tax=Kribbella sp. NPDC050820 TaxID=3155408 RepID=UPI0033C16B61
MATKRNGLGAAAPTLQRPSGRSLAQAAGTSSVPGAPTIELEDKPRVGIVNAMRMSGAGASVPEVPTDTVAPNPDNPRVDLGDLSEIAKSIEEKGILQPLVVTTAAAFLAKQPHHREAIGAADYVIVAGHRRHGGAQLASRPTVPIIVRDDLAGSDDVAQTALIENIHRRNLVPLEEARGFQLLVELGKSQREISKSTGISQAQISKRLTLLKLPQAIQDALADDLLSVNEALTLAQLPDEERVTAFTRMRENGWSADQAVAELSRERATAEAIAVAEQQARAEKIPLVDPQETFGTAEHKHRLYEPADIETARTEGRLAGHATRDGLQYFTMTPAKKAPKSGRPVDSDDKAHREAQAARTEAGRRAVATLPAAQEVRTALTDAVLAGRTPFAECLKLVHSWLGDKLGSKADDPTAWHRTLTEPTDRTHAAWAMTIAARELNIRWARGPWPPEAIDYVVYLQRHVGYSPTPWEQQKIDLATVAHQDHRSQGQEATDE